MFVMNIFALILIQNIRAVYCVIVSQHLLDPVQCSRYPGVDPGVFNIVAAKAMAHNPNLKRSGYEGARIHQFEYGNLIVVLAWHLPIPRGDHQRATRVPPAAFCHPARHYRAQHRISDILKDSITIVTIVLRTCLANRFYQSRSISNFIPCWL